MKGLFLNFIEKMPGRSGESRIHKVVLRNEELQKKVSA